MEDIASRLQSVLSDEESMKQIKELAGMLGGESLQPQNSPPSDDGIDTAGLMQLGQLLHSTSREDDNTRLLTALRPLLKEETQHKLDRVIKLYRLMNLYPLLKQSGIVGGDLLGIF